MTTSLCNLLKQWAMFRQGSRRLHERGSAVFAAFVLGYDSDDAGVFGRTLQFLEDAGADALQLTVLTPFPGTPLYRRLEAVGRIFDRNRERYDLGHVVFTPARMSTEELESGHDRILRSFYSRRRILGRTLRQLRYLRLSEVCYAALAGWGYRVKAAKDGYFERRPG